MRSSTLGTPAPHPGARLVGIVVAPYALRLAGVGVGMGCLDMGCQGLVTSTRVDLTSIGTPLGSPSRFRVNES